MELGLVTVSEYSCKIMSPVFLSQVRIWITLGADVVSPSSYLV